MLPSHFFVSECDGGLYDTRKPDWPSNPICELWMHTYTSIANTKQLKATLRAGDCTFPGCYPLYFITSDGECLLFQTVLDNLRCVLWSIQNKCDDGWRVVGCEVNYEDEDLYDAYTCKKIPSAYGESEEG